MALCRAAPAPDHGETWEAQSWGIPGVWDASSAEQWEGPQVVLELEQDQKNMGFCGHFYL